MYYPPKVPPAAKLSPVERERLRERDREARAQMIYEGSQDGINSGPLFGEMVRVNPKSNDFERQQIERKLGKFDDVKHLIADQDVTHLFGIDGQPPPSPAPAPGTSKLSSSSLSSHEFKKPNVCSQSSQPNRSSHHHHHHHSSSSQRGGFVKPADGKPAYSGRGFYPGQPMKHINSSSSSTDFRSSGLVPGKGPPPTLGNSTSTGSVNGNSSNHHSSSSGRSGLHEFTNNGSNGSTSSNNGSSSGSGSSMNSKMHARTSLPKLLCEPLLPPITLNGSGVSSQANVENILDEMTSSVRTPLTAIAATPRKETESKFTFNAVSGKMESILPVKPPVLDKNSRSNALNNILGPPGSRLSFLPASVFKPGQVNAPFLSPSNSSSGAPLTGSSSSSSNSTKTKPTSSLTSAGGSAGSGSDASIGGVHTSSSNNNNNGNNSSSGCGVNSGSNSNSNGSSITNSSQNGIGGSNNGNSAPTLTSSATSSSKTSSAVLPTLESDLSISSEDSNDDEENDDNDNSEEERNTRKSTSSQSVAQKPEIVGDLKLVSPVKSPIMSSEDVPDSSSSDDSESDSGSESDDSSSDSLSPPSLPLHVAPDPEDNKHAWNLKNFLPPSHGNSTPAPQTPQACENDAKMKTEDSDSSGDTTQNTQVVSSSSSDSDSDKGDKHKASRTTQSDDSTDEDNRVGKKRKYHSKRRSSSSSSQSSDDSDHPTKAVNQSGNVSVNNGANASSTSMGSSTSSASANSSSTSNLTVVGVVRPHQRKPPSPQLFNLAPSSAAEDRFSFVQQQRSSLQQQMSSAPEPQCELPSHSDNTSSAVNTSNISRNRVSETFASRRSSATSGVKSTEKPTKGGGTGKGRKPKSPARVLPAEPPAKKGRGRKKAVKVPDTDSEDDVPKVKVPERKRPGRPPLKRNDNEDDDWTAGQRRKTIEKFPPANVWGGRERRRSSLRYSFTQDSDSDPELLIPPVKPTARVQPVNKKKELAGLRSSRDSSCESKNDSDFTVMTSSGSKSTVTKAEESPPKLDVEGATIADKKKSDTLRKLFSRREEGGGKGGGKGKGGKGKCGVIVESEAERKMSGQRSSLSPAPTLRRVPDPMSDISRVEISPPLQQQGVRDRVSELSRVHLSDDSSRVSVMRRGHERVPTVSPSPVRPSVELPKLTYNANGKPSLMCKIDLAKIPFFMTNKKRSEEIRTKSELADTRQASTSSSCGASGSSETPIVAPPSLDIVSVPLMMGPLSDTSDNETTSVAPATVDRKHGSKKHSKQKTKSNKRKHRMKEEPPPAIFTPTVHTPSVDPDSDSMSSDTESRKKRLCTSGSHISSSMRPQLDNMHNLMNTCYPLAVDSMQESSLGVEQRSDDESWRSNASSCSSCSGSPTPHRGDKYGMRSSSSKHHSKRHHRRKNRTADHVQRHSSLMDAAPPMTLSVPSSAHGSLPPEPSALGYPRCSEVMRPVMLTHHGIYYSYLEHKVSEELNSESDNISPNVYLMEAKRLKHAADIERDLVSQGMQYLEAILSFVLTGHVLERRNQIDTAFSMYSETLKLIVYISKKFRTLCPGAAQSNIPNKIATLSLRCESILNLKLYTMREMEVRDVHNVVTEYFSKPTPMEAYLVANQGIPSPHSPTPSPASSVGDNSSGYSSGDRRTGGVAQCIAVPVNLHQALQKQHNFYSNLIASFNYWEEADKLIFGGNKDFFIELDRFCGPLTLHSSLKDLVHYVRVGIQRLKAIISHHHRV